jgi:hypothetical protein
VQGPLPHHRRKIRCRAPFLWVLEPWVLEPWVLEPWVVEPWVVEPWVLEPWVLEPWVVDEPSVVELLEILEMDPQTVISPVQGPRPRHARNRLCRV